MFKPDESDMNFHFADCDHHEVAADPNGVAAYAAAIMAGVSGIGDGRSVEDISTSVGGSRINQGLIR